MILFWYKSEIKMIKFKTLFRKGHSSSSSSSGSKNKNASDRVKTNHFGSAGPIPNNSTNNCGDNEFERQAVTSNDEFSKMNKLEAHSDVFEQQFNERCVDEMPSVEHKEFENIKKQLECVLNEKDRMELAFQELMNTHGELQTLRKEIQTLKEQKEELQNNIILRISNVDSLPHVNNGEKNGLGRCKKLPNSAPASIAPPSGSTEMLNTPDWDKQSSSSLSEVSVACLQDRIMQMEETHYSTSEELQATLQELADLQVQLSELQNDNERLGEEKGVLLESLCRQTEKLEDARNKVDTLQDLLLDPNKSETSFSEREQKLVVLLKDGQQEREFLMVKQKELMNDVEELNRGLEHQKQESNVLRERVHLLESTVDATNAERKQLEHELALAKEESSCKNIEIKRLTTLLENARSKIEELEEAREKKGDKGELDDMIDVLRKEKDHLEIQLASMQEQLSKSICEVAKLKEQLLHVQEECRVTRNNAKSALNDLEYKCEKNREDALRLNAELHKMRENYLELEVQCQCHLDDKQQLKNVLLQTQQHLAESDRQNLELKQSLEEEKKYREQENLEWKQFQDDLLMTVRVANDLKTEAQGELQRLVLENKQLRDKIRVLETKIQTMTKVDNTHAPLLHRTLSNNESSSIFSTVMSHEINRRNNASKILRQDSRLSVKSLIESIENATKQAKTDILGTCSRSNSTSSLNGLAHQMSVSPSPTSEFDMTSLTRLDNHDLHMTSKNLNDHISPTTSILTSKGLDFARKASTGDLSERKDPLQALVKNGGSKRNALLKWCQHKTIGYPNIDITNFSSSWNDGMALCALLHSYLPDKIPYETLNPADKKRNFSIAFAAAESVGIKTSLNINDMIQEERPDWNQVMAYVVVIFKHFES